MIALAVVQLTTQALSPAAAQPLGGFDVEPPLIEHVTVPLAPAALRQDFVAEVTDDNLLSSVTLHWRFEGETRYATATMNRAGDSDTWSAQVPTSPEESRAIEYYLEARDAGGNRTVRGFVFSPLVRRIAGQDAAPSAPPPSVERSRVIYYVLGALAIGVIAGFASAGGGRSEEDGPGECGSDGCEVVITFQSPVVQ